MSVKLLKGIAVGMLAGAIVGMVVIPKRQSKMCRFRKNAMKAIRAIGVAASCFGDMMPSEFTARAGNGVLCLSDYFFKDV